MCYLIWVNVRTALHREAQGHLQTLLPVWPTSTCTRFFEAPQRAHPEDPTFSVQQAAPIFRPMPSRWVGWLSLGFPPNILCRLRYGAIRIITQTPRDYPVNCLHPRRHFLGMELAATRKPPTPWQYASCGDPRNQYPSHPSEIGASLSFPFPRTETVNINWRHGSRHRDSAKNFPTWRGKTKEARPQRSINAGSRTQECKLDPLIPAPKCAT